MINLIVDNHSINRCKFVLMRALLWYSELNDTFVWVAIKTLIFPPADAFGPLINNSAVSGRNVYGHDDEK